MKQLDQEQLKKQFEEQTGIHAGEISSIAEAWPLSYSVTIRTAKQTFNGWLTTRGKLLTVYEDK